MPDGTAGQSDIDWLGGPGDVCHLTVLAHQEPRGESRPIESEQKTEGFVKLLRSHRVSQFSWMLLALSLYSYRVREILVCWLFFSAMLAVLALLVAGGILVWHGGKHVRDWASPFVKIALQVAADPTKLLLTEIVGGRKWK